MIKCNVTLIGTIYRNGEHKTDKEGRPFLSFAVRVVIPAKSGINQTIEVSVAKDGNADATFDFAEGTRVKIAGILTFRKRNDNIYYNLSASKVDLNPEEQDSVTGTMSFRGTIGGKGVVEKQSKKGAFRVFDGYSSEKVGEGEFAYTWVHFVDFQNDRQEWLQPKAGANIEGELGLEVFKDRISINCKVSSLSPWDKQASNRQ